MGLNRIGKRIQAREGSRWVRNTTENTLGLSVPVCPSASCRRLNPCAAGTVPRRCHACNGPMLPACPEHGEANCDAGCKARPCTTCGGTGPVPALVDPFKWNQGRLCRTCGRERSPCAALAATPAQETAPASCRCELSTREGDDSCPVHDRDGRQAPPEEA